MLIRIYQCLDQFHGLRKRSVRVACALYNEQFSLQSVGELQVGAVVVTRWVFIWQTHVRFYSNPSEAA